MAEVTYDDEYVSSCLQGMLGRALDERIHALDFARAYCGIGDSVRAFHM